MVRKKSMAFAVLFVVTTGSLLLGGWAAQEQQEHIDDHDAGTSDEPVVIEQTVDGHVSTYAYRAEVFGQCGAVSNPAGGLPLMPSTIGSCGSGYVPFVPWSNSRGSLSSMDNETETVTLDMVWEADEPLGEHLGLVAWCSAATGVNDPCYHVSSGMTSPATIRIDRAAMEDQGVDMDQNWYWQVVPRWGMLGTYDSLGVDVGASYQQEYTITFRYYQGEPAPVE